MKKQSRKLLVAAAGVAAINYANACTSSVNTGNPAFPENTVDAQADAKDDALIVSGNLIAPSERDAGKDVGDAEPDAMIISGNLIAPPEQDAGPADSGSD
jgi:hypothetical protein